MYRFLSLLTLATLSLNILVINHVHAQSGRIIGSYYHSAVAQKLLAAPPKTSQWSGYFSSANFQSTTEDQQELVNVQGLIRKAMANLSYEHTKELQHLTVRKNNPDSPRGLAGSHRMILTLDHINSQEELTGVFTHEVGHIVDLGLLKGTSNIRSGFFDRGNFVPADDPSIDFYRISWVNNTQKKAGNSRSDFVSGYAMSNPFEDFAETFIFYRYHGDKFRALGQESEALRNKYKFMRDTVFYGEEFQKGTDNRYVNNIWDTTLLALES